MFTKQHFATIEREDDELDEIEVAIDYLYRKGAPPILNDIHGGDPGYPPEVDILRVYRHDNGQPIELTDNERAQIVEDIIDNHESGAVS